MKIQSIDLLNYRAFEKLHITFPETNVAVFVGENGKGKSSVLDAIAVLLSQLVVAFHDSFSIKANSKEMPQLLDTDIRLHQNTTTLSINVTDNNKADNWQISKDRFKNAELGESAELAIDKFLTSHSVLAYYNTNRMYSKSETRSRKGASVPLQDYYGIQSKSNFFDDFVNWFRTKEDEENEHIRRQKNFDLVNPELEILRNVFEQFFKYLHNADYSKLRIERDSLGKTGLRSSQLMVTKNGLDFEVAQLSDGEKVLMLMVCDIARRLAIANEHANDTSLNDGIVLIDEIELHLHPRWQRQIISALRNTFPNIQFIITTHSPQVLSEIKQNELFILADNQVYQPSTNPIGRDTNAILEEIMGTSKRPQVIEDLSEQYFSFINQQLWVDAENTKRQLLAILDATDPIFARAEALISRKKMLTR
jgi:predicted ATP-binding protein involved in virulence